MTNNQLKKEWDKLKYQIIECRPNTEKPSQSDILQKREILLLALDELDAVEGAIEFDDKKSEIYHTKVYENLMSIYFNWNKIKQYTIS